MTDPAPLWSILLDDGGRLDVFPVPYRAGHHYRAGDRFLMRVTLPHPDYRGPDVVAEKTVTRERLRRLWLAVQ